MTIERALVGTTDAAAAASVYVEDVFSTYLYNGTGASQTINNGIDLSTKGGMVWFKGRSDTYNHGIYDTIRGRSYVSSSDYAGATTVTGSAGLTSFNTSGFSVGSNYSSENPNGATVVSWTFRKQPKFFDIVTYTGNGASTRDISHNLGATPGMIIIFGVDAGYGPFVYHKSTGADYFLSLNSTSAANSFAGAWRSVNSSTFSVDYRNGNGVQFVAYLFADSNSGGFGPAGTDSVVACGSFPTDASSVASVSLGWEPQFVLIKASNTGSTWFMLDNMRGATSDYNNTSSWLKAQASDAEATYTNSFSFNATGFKTLSGGYVPASSNYIYLAIRRGPMKTPTDATKVFAPITSSAATGTKLTTGFPIDLQIPIARAYNGVAHYVTDRLRGFSSTTTESGNALDTSNTGAESSAPTSRLWDNNGFQMPSSWATLSTIFWNFSRAPGFFDVVCYPGGLSSVNHNLGVVPELAFIKVRDDAYRNWVAARPGGVGGYLNTTSRIWSGEAFIDLSSATATTFPSNANPEVGAYGKNYVAYLFATCPGVSKVGSYTGTGTTKQIDCGFTAGARFVLIKRTDSTGSWYVWDTARGIVSGNDPYLLLNSTAAEVTNTDYIDPYSAGFEISSTAPAEINANGGSFVFLAVA